MAAALCLLALAALVAFFVAVMLRAAERLLDEIGEGK